MAMEGRKYRDENYDYRYGFNGKEDDKDFGDKQLIQDYGFRLYNPALVRFLSVDPLAPSYPWYTPYQFAGNKPITYVDLDGLEEENATEKNWKSYRKVEGYGATPGGGYVQEPKNGSLGEDKNGIVHSVTSEGTTYFWNPTKGQYTYGEREYFSFSVHDDSQSEDEYYAYHDHIFSKYYELSGYEGMGLFNSGMRLGYTAATLSLYPLYRSGAHNTGLFLRPSIKLTTRLFTFGSSYTFLTTEAPIEFLKASTVASMPRYFKPNIAISTVGAIGFVATGGFLYYNSDGFSNIKIGESTTYAFTSNYIGQKLTSTLGINLISAYTFSSSLSPRKKAMRIVGGIVVGALGGYTMEQALSGEVENEVLGGSAIRKAHNAEMYRRGGSVTR